MTTTSKSPEELIAECQGLVRSLAYQIHRKLPPRFDLEDIIADGQTGLAEAARDFDPTRGAKFSTYAYYRIRGAIYDGISNVGWTRRGSWNYQRLANETLRADAEAQRPARGATAVEDEAAWLHSTTAKLAIVYLGAQTGGGDRQWEAVDQKSPNPAFATAVQEEMDKLHELLDRLPESTARLIRAVYFEGQTLQEAGEAQGHSKSWASRLHHKALEQLARSLRRLGVEN